MAKHLYLITIFLMLSNIGAKAQCCSAGNPFFYGEQENMSQSTLKVIGGYKYSKADTYYNGSDPVDIDFIDKAYMNYLNLQFLYGISNKFTIQTELGYFINKTEIYKKEGWDTQTGRGLGDAVITLKYMAYKNFVKHITLIPSIGIVLPIGEFDLEANNVKLPITLQPSSGSVKYLLNIYLNKGFKNPKFNTGVFGSVEFAQTINSKNFYYKYGNRYFFSVIGSYIPSEKFTLGLELRSDNRAESKREDDQIVSSSGYNIVYLIPHLSYSPFNYFYISGNINIPVYKYYNGIQLSNSLAFSIRLSYDINFKRNKIFEDLKVVNGFNNL